jgi:2-aminoethylphosphonate-pyruvate transaminase
LNAPTLPDNPYLLLTPGPLTTTQSVKAVMLRDWCTWDDDYHAVVQDIRRRLTALATEADGHTCVLMQGSGTFAVESVISSIVPGDGKLLVIANGAYGERIFQIAQRHRISVAILDSGELKPPDLNRLFHTLKNDVGITHVAVVHCETTTGMLNPVAEIGHIVKQFGKTCIVDAMSSFGGIPLDMAGIGADFLISSANKCIQGVPGFGFIIARTEEMMNIKGRARTLSLDLFDQWDCMERKNGKWRYTSPTHTVRAFAQALNELAEEGGVAARHARYRENHRVLVAGMRDLGFRTLLPDDLQSPFITAFHSPTDPSHDFFRFYNGLKRRGFVIYPGKVTSLDTFRIGNIGDVTPPDMQRLVAAAAAEMDRRP